MHIHFSNQDNLRNFRSFTTKSLDFSNPTTLSISVHNKWVTVHPVHLTLAAAIALKVGKENATISTDVPPSGLYLDRMGLYKFLATPSPFTYNQKEPAGRMVPLTVIKTAADQSQFITNLIPLLHLSPTNTNVIIHIVGELVRNVLEHAHAPNGAVVAAQYYKKTNRISIGVCDTGIGIRQSIQTHWHPHSNLDAIHLALTPGITGTTNVEGGTFDNAGAGLFIIKSIAKMTRSYFSIYSGTAEYTMLKYKKRIKESPRLYADPTRDPHNETDLAQNFIGTLVGIDVHLDETIVLNELLAKIGHVHDSAIRSRKQIKYQEPKFI